MKHSTTLNFRGMDLTIRASGKMRYEQRAASP
jgi:hypothetical protein